MEFQVGDYVLHNDYPPIEGFVAILRPGVKGTEIGVFQQNGTLFYDDISTWLLLNKAPNIQNPIVDTVEDPIQGEVIDVDYTII